MLSKVPAKGLLQDLGKVTHKDTHHDKEALSLTALEGVLLAVQQPVIKGEVFVGQAAEVLATVDVVSAHSHSEGQWTGVLVTAFTQLS